MGVLLSLNSARSINKDPLYPMTDLPYSRLSTRAKRRYFCPRHANRILVKSPCSLVSLYPLVLLDTVYRTLPTPIPQKYSSLAEIPAALLSNIHGALNQISI